jgi:hypothetical protein
MNDGCWAVIVTERMYDGGMELTPGHIHQAANHSGGVATIWPTPTPGLWHVSAPPKRATEEPVSSDQVEAVLVELQSRGAVAPLAGAATRSQSTA